MRLSFMEPKTKRFSKEHRILQALKSHDGCSGLELSKISLRYGAYIFDLRRDGHNIETVAISVPKGIYRYYLRSSS